MATIHAWSAAALLGLPAVAHADAASDLDALLGQSIVSTASKDTETDTTAPATATVITAEQLQRHGIRSLDEAINYLSLGMSASTPLHTVEVGSRGVLISSDYGNHVLLLLDGHVLNEPWNGTAYFERGAAVPFDLVDHIEIILGPGSVLYGSQAMLAVINIVTKRAKNFGGLHVSVEGDTDVPTRADGSLRGPASNGWLGDLGRGYRLAAGYGREFSVGSSPGELTLGIDYYAHHGPTWQVGPQAYGDDSVTLAPKDFGPRAQRGVWGGELEEADMTQVPAGYVRFALGDFRAALRAGAYLRSMTFPDSITSVSADFDDPFNREADRFLGFDASQHIAVSARLELVARGYADLYDYAWYNRSSAPEDCPEQFAEGCDRDLEATARTLGGELRGTFQWPVLRASTMLGLDAKLRDVEHELRIRSRPGFAPVSPPSIGAQRTDALLGPYLAQSFSPSAWLDVNLGLRLDHDTRFGDKLSPRSAVGVSPWDGSRLKLIYAEAFRAPTAYEITYRDPNSEVDSPGLGAETVHSIEGSIEQRLGRHRLLLGVFRSWWSDLVSYESLSEEDIALAVERGLLVSGVSEVYRRANLGRIDSYGLNAAYDGDSADGRWRFGLDVTATRTYMVEDEGTGTTGLPVASHAFGNARLSYDLGSSLPTLALAARYQARRKATRFYDGGFSPAPSAPPLMALRFALNGTIASLPGLGYRFGGDYSFAKVEPYVIGAVQYATDDVTRAELAPIRRLQLFIGLQYAFEAR